MIVTRGKFAYRRTAQEVRDDFEAFAHVAPETLVTRDTRWSPRTNCPVPKKLPLMFRTTRGGQLLSEYFHWKTRVQTATKWMASGEDVLRRYVNEPDFLRGAKERIVRASKHRMSPEELAYDVVRVNSALMTLTHFRVSVSRFLCAQEKPRRVLDFSAGWGDRLTGFLASPSVEHITLIDPRPSCRVACLAQHSFVRSDKTLEFHQYGAEEALPTLRAASVDLVVTSPPYFDMELYGETAKEAVGQIRLKVKDTEEYLRQFLFPVLRECQRVLVSGGLLALNVDDHDKEGVVLCAPMLRFMKTLPRMQLVGTAGLRKGSGFGQGLHAIEGSKAEPVYLFRKA